MIILEDKNNKEGQHDLKHAYFAEHGIEVVRYTLPVGDYVLGTDKVMDVIERKQKRGIAPSKMDFLGSYGVVVDTKNSCDELYQDVVTSHDRFRDEQILAQNNGIKLIILVENTDGISSLNNLPTWKNPRRERWYRIWNAQKQGKAKRVKIPKQPPMSSESLAKSLVTMESKYGTQFLFCRPEEAGQRIVEILTTLPGRRQTDESEF